MRGTPNAAGFTTTGPIGQVTDADETQGGTFCALPGVWPGSSGTMGLPMKLFVPYYTLATPPVKS